MIDDNDKARAGKLPADPRGDAKLVSLPGGEAPPRVFTVQEIMALARDAAQSQSASRACTTGLRELDETTGGLQPGLCWVFGADTSWGKSTYLVMLTDENLKRGRRVLIVSAEDDEVLYGRRLLSRRTGVQTRSLRNRSLTRAEAEAVDRAVEEAETSYVFLDARGKSAESVTRNIERMIREQSIDLVLVDYLQEIRSEKRTQDRRTEVSDVAAALRHTIKAAGAAGCIFSQITIQDGKAYPDKHSLRESRDVANGADVILMGITAAEDIPVRRLVGGIEETIAVVPRGHKALKLEKCKEARVPAIVPIAWNETTANFVETVEPPDPALDAFDDYVPEGF